MKTDSKMKMWQQAVSGGEIFFLLGNTIVTPVSDGFYAVVATIGDGMMDNARYLLRQAQLGSQTERLIDHYLKDVIERGEISCPIWTDEEEEEEDSVTLKIVAEALDDLIDNFDPNDRIHELIEEVPALKKYMKENL